MLGTVLSSVHLLLHLILLSALWVQMFIFRWEMWHAEIKQLPQDGTAITWQTWGLTFYCGTIQHGFQWIRKVLNDFCWREVKSCYNCLVESRDSIFFRNNKNLSSLLPVVNLALILCVCISLKEELHFLSFIWTDPLSSM